MMEESVLSNFPSLRVFYTEPLGDRSVIRLEGLESSPRIETDMVLNVLYSTLLSECKDFIKNHDPECICEAYKMCKGFIALDDFRNEQ